MLRREEQISGTVDHAALAGFELLKVRQKESLCARFDLGTVVL